MTTVVALLVVTSIVARPADGSTVPSTDVPPPANLGDHRAAGIGAGSTSTEPNGAWGAPRS
ncbi:hypothetical protein K7G98_00725 [Saccharothrix sp. MB29]|nr:hypothetical protein [Saccharothrix sp. MB29]